MPTPTPTPTPTPDLRELTETVRDLVRLVDERFPDNAINEFVAPIATIVLALAAVVVAVFSWRTSRRANQIVETHRQQDRAEKDARFRRGVAVDAREWLAEATWRAKFGVYVSYDDPRGEELEEQRKQIEKRLEREGEENGLRLMKLFQRRLRNLDREIRALPSVEVGKRRHPSRMNNELEELAPLLTAWARDPKAVEGELASDDAAVAKEREDNAEQIRKTYDDARKKAAAARGRGKRTR
ncbi:hypothetical protein ACFC14_18170 [Microbacterium sp. NPDC055988]|uniref:hypothetical protein n=1 Tax=Microbacterium sp. NPDC055988 TaxID=3345671 RepID=UPI0035D6A112